MSYEYCDIDLPGHLLIGQIVAVRAMVFTAHPEQEHPDPTEPDALVLVFADGREVLIRPTGYEADGLAVELRPALAGHNS